MRRLAQFVALRLRGGLPDSQPLVESLEPRLMLSAEFGPGLDPARDALANDPYDAPADAGADYLFAFLRDAAGDGAAPLPFGLEELGETLNPALDPSEVRHEIVFVDASVDDYTTLIDALRRAEVELEIVVLDSARDGVAQIDAVLAAARDIDAVHVISHGSDSGLQLGNTWLSTNNLAAYADSFGDWQQALDGDADIFLYGCDLAGSADGRALIDAIALLTGADVAASDDLTGATALGGDWDLEYVTGRIDGDSALQVFAGSAWSGVLGQITVTTGADTLNGDADTSSLANLALNPGADGEISLREAIIAANNDTGADVIFLAADTYGITRSATGDTGGDFDIRDDLSIVGVSPATSIVDGNNFSSVFDVHDDDAITVTFTNLTIQRGSTSLLVTEDGAGLYVYGSGNTPEVFLSNVRFTGNNTSGLSDQGGAIYNAGNLTIENALIDNNASKRGGGIYNAAGATLSLTNVTLSGNETHALGGQHGGGLYNAGTATIVNSTITLNDANADGGGIYRASGTVSIVNSIVAGNTDGSDGPDIFGTVASLGNNIIGDTSDAGGFVGSDRLNVDPLLDALADNGGSLMTHAPQAASEAIDNAAVAFAPGFDQRGIVRDDGSPDIGAFEFGAATVPTTSGLWLSTNQDVMGGGQAGVDDWDDADLIAISGPELNLGYGLTSGTFSVAFAGNGFDPGWDIAAAHLVANDIQIGASNFQLQAGDLLFTVVGSANLTSNNLVALEAGFSANLGLDGDDLAIFRPDTAGDYSRGQFGLLIENLPDATVLRAITLVEQSTIVGEYTLEAGDFLYAQNGNFQDHSIWLYETNTLGIGATPDNRLELLNGDDAGVDISDKIFGIDLVETPTLIGHEIIDRGTILLVVDNDDDVGNNDLVVDEFDVFQINVITSSLAGAGTGNATAYKLFDGSDVAFDSTAERIVALTLAPTNSQPVATNLMQVQTYTEGDGSVALDDIAVSDTDNGEMVTATLTLADPSAGVLTTSGMATYTAGTGVWMITDTVANVNSALALVSFTPATENDQDTTIAVSISDGGEAGTVAATGTITLDVTPVNDQIVVTNASQTIFYNEDDPGVALNDIFITDVDTGEIVTATLTLADTSAGALTTSGSATYTAGTGVWTITDTIANVNAALAAASFTPTANHDQNTSIAVNIADGGENGTVAVTGTITLSVTPVNDQPTATNVTQIRGYEEGDPSVSINDIVVTDVDTGETITATLTLANTATGSLTTSGTATYTAGTGVWTITDTVANVNAALAAVSFTPIVTNDVDTTIAVSISDGGENGTVAVTGTISLDVDPSNSQLAATNVTQTQAYTEGDVTVALDDIVVTDPDLGEIVTASLTLADPATGSLTTSGTATYTAGTGVWTITDTVVNVNAALAAVSFTPATDNDVDTTIAVTIADGGEVGTLAVTGTITLDVTAVNDQLAATNVTQTQAYTEGDITVALDDIVVSDVDTNEIVTATLTLANPATGTLTTSGTATYTAGTGVWTITDTVANVNTALAAVSFTPATDNDLDTTIAVNIADGGEGGTVAVTGTITLDVTPVNDQPTATDVTQTQGYTEGDATLALDDIVVTDPDTGEIVTATLTLANPATGVLTTSGTATYTAGTGVWTITDTVANVNTALAAVSFTPATENDQNTTIAVSIVDGGENGTVAVTDTITLDVTPVNDQLAATNVTQTKAYNEGDPGVALDDIVVTDVDTDEIVTATLTLANPAAGVLTTSGTATYTAGTGVWTITDTVANVNSALAAVNFTPATDNDQDTTIAVSIADGGEDDTVAVTGTITLDVTAVNDQLAATNVTQTKAYNEGDPSVALDDIVITDVDTGETVTATLTLANPATGALTTSGTATYTAGTGVWTITDTVANVNTALAAVSFSPLVTNVFDTTIAVNIADGGEGGTVAVTGTITLDVTPVNTQLTATNTTQTQAYIEGAGSVALDDIIVTDPDFGEIITATLTLADPNAGVLTVSGTATFSSTTGVWTITNTVANVNAALAAVSFTAAATYDLDTTIAVSIADGGEFATTPVSGLITLDVTPVNEQPGATNLNQARTYTEDTTAAFDPIVITDNDYLETVTAQLTLQDPAAGTLSTSGLATFDSGTGVWRASGSVASVNAALAAVTFSPAANYDTNVAIGVRISDGGEGGASALNGTINLAAIAVGDTPVVTSTTTNANTPSGAIIIERNAHDGAEVTHFRISGIVNGRLTLADGTTPVNEGDYITAAAGNAGLRFVPNPDSAATGRFAVEASQDGSSVAAQSGKAHATIMITGDPEAEELAGTAGAFVGENAVSVEADSIADDQPAVSNDSADPAPQDTADSDDASMLAAAAVEAGISVADDTPAIDAAVVTTIAGIDTAAVADSDLAPELRDGNGEASSQTGFVERFMFSAEAGLIRTDSYVDADFALRESDGSGGAYDALLSDVEFLHELDVVREDLNDVAALGQTFVGSSVALSTGISVGYVVWIARGGLLLASLVSSMPAWRLVDPLPILARLEDPAAAAGEDDSLASIIEQSDDGPAVVEHTVNATPVAPQAH